MYRGMTHVASYETLGFDAPHLFDALTEMTSAQRDTLPFGVVGLDDEGLVVSYNQAEAALSGLTPSRVVGRRFFKDVAPCADVPSVSHRFFEADEVDEVVPFVFALRMTPTPVRIRLLKRAGAQLGFLIVERA